MGACASVPKAMRAKATNTPTPEPREEETSAAEEETTVTAVEKAEGANDNSQKKAAKVEAPKEATDKSKIEALTPPIPAATVVEEKITPAEKNN